LLDVIVLVIRIKNVFLKEPPPEWGKSKGKRESLRSITKDKKGGSLADYLDGFDCVDGSILKECIDLGADCHKVEHIEVVLVLAMRDRNVLPLLPCRLVKGHVE
tara:strand:+ start:228 stop:539 length:312 start_codon:yes stop_codon:yes gene_type:complete